MITQLLSSLWRRIKPALAKISPSAAQLIPSWRMYRRSKARFGPFQHRLKPLLFDQKAPFILSGPFQGMPYLNEIGFCGPILPKWIGSYESELHSFIGDVLADPPRLIIDIGSAEGYYSVLLAARLPTTRVVSFDYDILAVRAQKRLAAMHRVANLEIEKQCGHQQLVNLISSTEGKTLVICDIEGAEMEMIDPLACPALLKANLLVELHEGIERSGNDMAIELGTRFRASHSASFIPISRRNAGDYASICPALKPEDLRRALDEDRGVSCGWLVIRTLS